MDISKMLQYFIDTVSKAGNMVNEVLFKGEGAEVLISKADGDVTRKIDCMVEDFVKERILSINLPVRFISEECGEVDLLPSPEYILLLDPIDGTDLAVRGYPLCSVNISLHKIDTMETVLAVIGDIFQGKIYYASEDGAFLKHGEKLTRLKVSNTTNLKDAMLVSYSAKPYRMVSLCEQKELLGRAGLFFNYGGPLSIAKVGEGTVDAVLEFQKGFKAIDFASGAYIAKMAGAVITDLKGNEIKLPRELETRFKFLVSATKELHEEVLRSLV